MDKWRLFFSYYWTFLKHLGSRVWETRGGELMSALLLSVVTFFVSYIFKQVDALTAFQIAILALVGWLCVFALGHIITRPSSFATKALSPRRQTYTGSSALSDL